MNEDLSSGDVKNKSYFPFLNTTNFAALTLDLTQGDLLTEMIQRSNLRSDFFIISLLTKGSGKVRINLKEFTLKTNDLLIIPPDATKDNIEISKEAVLKVIAYTSDFLVPLSLPENFWDISDYFSAKNIPVWHLSEAEAQTITSLVNQLESRNKNEESHPYSREILHFTFMIFILELAAIAPNHTQESKQRLTRKELLTINFYALAKKHFKEARTLRHYADLLFVTPKYLTETVKEISGKTAGDVIDSFTLLEARIQLGTTSKSISEIASELNFSDQSSFGKFFKRLTGLAPKYYRSGR